MKIAAAALLAGEKPVAVRFLHDYLERFPHQVTRIATLFVDQLAEGTSTADAVSELTSMLPNSPLLQAEVAENFSHIDSRKDLAQKMSNGIRLDSLVEEAKQQQGLGRTNAKSWLLVAWLANDRGDVKSQVAALEFAIITDPMNHAMRFDFAKLLLKIGERGKSIEQAERAFRLSPDTKDYRDFLDKIR